MRTINSVTFYKEDGTIITTIYLPCGTTHKQRLEIAEENKVEGWHHYSMRDTAFAMKKDDDKKWFEIDKITGKII